MKNLIYTRTDYICPVCHKTNRQTNNIADGSIESVREIVYKIRVLGYDAVLDEHEFCVHCSGKENIYDSSLIFKFRFSPESEYHEVKSNISNDYRIALRFLEGNYFYRKDGNICTIRDNIDVIQKMLGLGQDINFVRKITDMDGKIHIPKLAILELTYKCNHSCLFCSCPWESNLDGFPKYKKETELNVDEWKKAIDILSFYGIEKVSISGGEALLKDGLLDILKYIREKTSLNVNSEIVLISNGLSMNENFIAAFKKYNVHLSLSLPGLTTFEKHTGVDNANGVLYWLDRCRQNGISTTVNVTVTKINYFELYETVANGLIAGADTLLLNRFLVGGRGIAHRDELSLTAEEINGMLDTAEDVLKKSNRMGSVGTDIPLCLVKDKSNYKKLKISSLCAAGKDFFVIDPSGYIRACNHSPNKCGHIFNHIFNDNIITDVNYWNCFVTRDYIPSKCIKCRDVNYCDCGCREVANIMYGSIKEEDDCIKHLRDGQ